MRPISKTAALVALAIALAGSLAGCIPSETLTQILYVQDERYEIDYDAPKVYKNTVEAEQLEEEAPSLDEGDGSASEEEESLPNFEEEAAEDEQEVEQSQERTDNSANLAPAQVDADAGEASDSETEGEGTAHGDGETGETSDSGGRSKGDKGGGKQAGDKRSKASATPGQSFADVGNDDELPEGVKSVAAVGNAAIVAAALGGQDGTQNLVAANKGLLADSDFKKVFAKKLSGAYAVKSLDAPKAIWNATGGAAADLTDANLEALIELAPDAVIVTEGESTLGEHAAAVLEAGIHVVYVPSMTSPTNIKAAIARIGELLARGGDTAAAQLAADYATYHDDLFAKYSSNSDVLYSLYVSNWETGVTYKRDKNRSSWGGKAENGVAVTAVGLSSQVPGLYMRAGGVVNTATEKLMFSQKIGKSIVWQAAGGTLVGGSNSEWTQNGKAGVSGVTEELPSGTGYADSSLLCAVVNTTQYRLGDSAFPAVIVKTSDIKKSFDADRKRANGLYAYYDPTSSGKSGGISTAIASKNYEVVVNPSGLFSSWASGSMESVLEVPWAYAQFHSKDFADLKAATAEFYKKFYGYAPGDFSGDYDKIVKAKKAS